MVFACGCIRIEKDLPRQVPGMESDMLGRCWSLSPLTLYGPGITARTGSRGHKASACKRNQLPCVPGSVVAADPDVGHRASQVGRIQKDLRRMYGRERLCGNWQWLILTESPMRDYNPIGLCVIA